MPILAPAPARFSTITVWPSACCSGDCRSRASTSDDPAGANGTMMRIGLFGASWARAANGRASAAIASRAMNWRRGINIPPPPLAGQVVSEANRRGPGPRGKAMPPLHRTSRGSPPPQAGEDILSFPRFIRSPLIRRHFAPTTLYAASGRLIPLSAKSPTGSTAIASSTAISTRELISICPGLASSHKRDATFDTVPIAA